MKIQNQALGAILFSLLFPSTSLAQGTSCTTAQPGSTGSQTFTPCATSMGEYWSYVLQPNEQLFLNLDYSANLWVGGYLIGDYIFMELELTDDVGTCTNIASPTLIGGTPGQRSVWHTNTSGAPITVTAKVSWPYNGCFFYDYDAEIRVDLCATNPEDGEEDNDFCGGAVSPSANPLFDLFVRAEDQDYYQYFLHPGETLETLVSTPGANSRVVTRLIDGDNCANTVGTTSVNLGISSFSRYTNHESQTKRVVLHVDVPPGSSIPICSLYNLSSTILPAEYTTHCVGDGGDQLGCTNCPCMNNAVPNSSGGCLNSSGTSANLLVSGFSSVSQPFFSNLDVRFELTGAPPNAFCILNSGDGVAPGNMANPCFGLGSGAQAAAFDGLRCAIVNTRRHGGRSADASGEIRLASAWGGPGMPHSGIAVASGFSAGQTRIFQVINRDDPLLGCMRGLNTTQGIGVTFTP